MASAKPAGSSVFGAAATSAPAGGLFPSLAASTPQAQQPSNGLFSKSTATTATPSLFPAPATTAQSGGGLFGSLGQSQQQQQAKPSGSLFSLGATQPAQQQQQPQQVVPGVKIDWSNIKPTTRFSDLHEDIQKQICAIDDFIQSQIQFSSQINAAMPAQGQLVESLPADVKYLEDREETVELAIERDAREVKAAKDLIRKDADEAKLSFAAIENLKLPIQFHYQPGAWPTSSYQNTIGNSANMTGTPVTGKHVGFHEVDPENGIAAGDLIAYFQNKVTEIQSRVEGFKKQVQELEEHMGTVELSTVEQIQRMLRNWGKMDGGPESAKKEQMADLVGALRGVESAIFRVAGKVGEAREGVVELQFPGGTNIRAWVSS